MRKIIGLLILSVLSVFGKAQEMPIYSQYLLNPYLINPAIAGINNYGEIQVMNRTQWVGIEDAPQTNVLSYHQRVGKVGLGGYVYADRNGNSSAIGTQVTFAYHIPLNTLGISRANKRKLSLGVSYILSQKKTDERLFKNVDGDPLISGLIERTLIFNANIGVYYVYKNFFSGFSCANLNPASNGKYSPQRNYFLQLGHFFDLQGNYLLESSVTSKFNRQWDWQLDLSTKLYLPNKRTWIALSIRNNMGYNVNDGLVVMPAWGHNFSRLHFAYAFDFGFNPIRSQNYGSHEFMLSFIIGNTKNPISNAYKVYK